MLFKTSCADVGLTTGGLSWWGRHMTKFMGLSAELGLIDMSTKLAQRHESIQVGPGFTPTA
jgi:hypothetical protein